MMIGNTLYTPSGLGPTFPLELLAAGFDLSDLPFTIHSTAVVLKDGMTADVQSAVEAVVNAHDPSKLAPAPVPLSVTDWQFAGQAYSETIISFDEAKAWVGSGVVPQSLLTAVDQAVTDKDQHDKVILFLMGSKEFPRVHPLTSLLAASFGKDTPAKIDAFFVSAAQR